MTFYLKGIREIFKIKMGGTRDISIVDGTFGEICFRGNNIFVNEGQGQNANFFKE